MDDFLGDLFAELLGVVIALRKPLIAMALTLVVIGLWIWLG